MRVWENEEIIANLREQVSLLRGACEYAARAGDDTMTARVTLEMDKADLFAAEIDMEEEDDDATIQDR